MENAKTKNLTIIFGVLLLNTLAIDCLAAHARPFLPFGKLRTDRVVVTIPSK